MTLPQTLAKKLHELYYGKNWTYVWMQPVLEDITWEEATQKIGDCNTIAELVYHIHYYILKTIPVFDGQPLDAHDKYSFDAPSINSSEDWNHLIETTYTEVQKMIDHLNEMPESRIWEFMTEEKYGTWYRNIHGIIEHGHYHFGQIVLLKKLIRAGYS